MRRRTFLPLAGFALAALAWAEPPPRRAAAPRPAAPRPAPAPPGDTMAAGRNALAHAVAGRWGEAEANARNADPLVAKIVTWMRLRAGGGNASELVSWVLDNPDWPAPEEMARRTEDALEAWPEDALALRFFAARPPRGLDGFQRYADALRREGREREADALLVRGWAEAPAEPGAEPNYLARNAGLLTPTVHWQRFDRLNLPREMVSASSLLPFLAPERQAAASARLAFAADGADEPALPQGPPDPGLAMHRARWLRRRNRDAEAAQAFDSAGEQRNLPTPLARAIWEERNLLARKLLRLGDAAAAYRVAAHHGQAAPSEQHQEGEFLAGFIALRRLERPAEAAAHFARLAEQSHSVITRARSRYWQGRAYAAKGEAAKAQEQYRAAAALPLAFYGQMAALALGENGAVLSARISRAAPPGTSAAEAQAVERRELARAVVLMAQLGQGGRARIFLLRLEELAATPGEKAVVARLANRIGRPDHAIWVTRRAGIAGAMLLDEGWPTPFSAPQDALDPALVYGITRQESNFDPDAVSGSNARGLMQLLPSTAQVVARKLGLRHEVAMLTGNPQHNLRLGTAYIEQMLAQFGGAVPLAVAAYNAGPGRVNEWLGAFGDPRAGFVTMLDWMELIPFNETRNYVQRVLENIAIYRARDAGMSALDHPMTPWLADGV